MDTKFTPGPWQLRERLLDSDPFEIIGNIDGDANDDGTPRMIYTEVTEVYDNEDAEANSRLIAAAPDMYEALIWAKKLIEALVIQSDIITLPAEITDGPIMKSIEAALAKVQS